VPVVVPHRRGGFLAWFAVGGLAFGWVALLAVILLATFIAIDIQIREFMDDASYNCWYTGVTNGAEIGLALGGLGGGSGGTAEGAKLLVSLVMGIAVALGLNQLPTSPVWKCI
jgi:hypothetical protein